MANNNLRTLETLFTKSIGDNELKKIIIPKIQRSYAQGRKEEIQVREGILQELFSVLKEGKDIELNFIYGSLKEKGTYELLDGQQRITTLFLLYLYVYLQENEALPLWFKDCLTYETRNSSRDFIGELCKLNKLTDDVYLLPSTYIKNQKWYSNAFHLDPTVEAMLVMLDAIDKYYKETGEQIAEKLKHIRFYALNLNDFNLTEELYIKMNARGLPLTPFENFKADLVGYYKPVKDATEKEFKSWLDFATKLDTEWIDIFWNKESSDKDVDNQYFRFFYRVATILTIIFSKENSDSFNFFRQESEIQTDDKARYLGFKNYSILFEALGKDKSREILTLLLDTLKSYPTIFKESKAAWGEQITPFADLKNYSQKNAVVFAGIVFYILTQEQTLDEKSEDFKHWMRVVWNIVENTDINGVVPQINTIRALYDLISNSKGDIYNCLAQQEDKKETRKAEQKEEKSNSGNRDGGSSSSSKSSSSSLGGGSGASSTSKSVKEQNKTAKKDIQKTVETITKATNQESAQKNQQEKSQLSQQKQEKSKEIKVSDIMTKQEAENTVDKLKDISQITGSKQAVTKLMQKGIMSGDKKGNFMPKKAVTRAEVAQVITNIIGEKPSSIKVADVSNNKWYAKAVQTVLENKIFSQDKKAKFRPDSKITRAELFVAVAKLKDIKPLDNARAKEVLSKYKDADSTPAWAIGYVSVLVEKGIVSGANNKLNANDTLTREQLSTIFANIID